MPKQKRKLAASSAPSDDGMAMDTSEVDSGEPASLKRVSKRLKPTVTQGTDSSKTKATKPDASSSAKTSRAAALLLQKTKAAKSHALMQTMTFAPSTSNGIGGASSSSTLVKLKVRAKAVEERIKKIQNSLQSANFDDDDDNDDEDDDDDSDNDGGGAFLPAMSMVSINGKVSKYPVASMSMLSMPSMVSNWDPRRSADWDRATPLPICKKRMQHDLAMSLSEEELLNIFIQPNEEDITKLDALVVGPSDTPYEGGFFKLFLRVGPDYPLKPPRVCNLTTHGGQMRFGPNLYAEGKICLSILGTWSGPSWTAAMSISVVLSSIQSLMSAGALRNEPGYDKRPLTDPDVVSYDTNIRHETIRIAILENLEQALRIGGGPEVPGQTTWPEKFKHAMFKSFHKNYANLLSICEVQIMNQPSTKAKPSYSLHSSATTHDWRNLKTQLEAMKKRVPTSYSR